MNTIVIVLVCAAAAVVNAENGFLARPQTSRIINGVEASPGEFPHQVTLLKDGYHICGGSVISTGWVLTASHCVDGQAASSLAVVVDLHDFNNPGNYIWFDIQSIVMHEKYNTGSGAFPNDVALLRLAPNAYDISKNIIPLASGSNDYAGTSCVISGWGAMENGNGASVLMKTDVDALTQAACRQVWGSNILSQHICVQGEGTTGTGSGACNGDSGGPLVCDGKLAGVTSFGLSGCHTAGTVTHPSVYARVSYYYDWVNTNCGNCL